MNRRDEQLTSELAALPKDIQPRRDLWPGIQSRLGDEGGRGGDQEVDSVRSISSAPGWNPLRRHSVPVEWAIAASVALAAIVGGTIWATMRTPVDAVGANPLAVSPVPETHAFAAMDVSEYEAAAADLEAVLETGRDLLEPRTLEVLEASLLAIDTAISEARAALVADPGHDGLQRMLQKNHRRKLDLLRQAAAAVQSRT